MVLVTSHALLAKISRFDPTIVLDYIILVQLPYCKVFTAELNAVLAFLGILIPLGRNEEAPTSNRRLSLHAVSKHGSLSDTILLWSRPKDSLFAQVEIFLTWTRVRGISGTIL